MTHLFAALPQSQHTLAVAASIDGIGLHSGQPVRLSLHPAPANTGIVFERMDRAEGQRRVLAGWRWTIDTRLCTVIANADGVSVATIEHLLAALRACDIDNAIVQLDGPEVPILDGSAIDWVRLIEQAGSITQLAPRRMLRVLRPLRIEDGDKWATLLPASSSRYRIEIDFAEPLIGRQRCALNLSRSAFIERIAAARTFGFAAEVAAMQAAGRARGGSLDNAVLVGDGTVLNPQGLRFADEFVRHKLLDCIGDLYLAGAPIAGEFIAYKPGHALNVALLRALFAERSNWCWSDESCPDTAYAQVA